MQSLDILVRRAPSLLQGAWGLGPKLGSRAARRSTRLIES